MSKAAEFSFGALAGEFDRHIASSIRGYDQLREDCVALSQYFIQKNSRVVDIGCSSGELLRSVRDYNQSRLSSAQYIGLDIEPKFEEQWAERTCENVRFLHQDATRYEGYENLSFVISMFTLQFMPEEDRLPLVKKIYEGLNYGGAFVLAEKVHAKNAKIQEMLTFLYYDFKKRSFSEQEILDKERSIRDQMKPWSEYKLFEMLRAAGFVTSNMQLFWRNFSFLGIMAMKPAPFR